MSLSSDQPIHESSGQKHQCDYNDLDSPAPYLERQVILLELCSGFSQLLSPLALGTAAHLLLAGLAPLLFLLLLGGMS